MKDFYLDICRAVVGAAMGDRLRNFLEQLVGILALNKFSWKNSQLEGRLLNSEVLVSILKEL